MRLLLLAALSCTVALAQDADLEVVFDRTTSTRDAVELVRQLSPRAETGGRFQSVLVEVQVSGPLDPELVTTLFDTGAVSVEVIDIGARFAGIMPEELEAAVVDRNDFLVSVRYPSTTASRAAAARLEAVVGAAPTRVEVRANLLKVTADDAPSLAARLRSAPNVVVVTAR